LALLERQLKVMTAVQARLHYAFKQELRLLAAIIRDYTDPDYDYVPDENTDERAKAEDYAYVDIIPVSDPNAATMSQRVVQYQAVIQMAQMAPDIYNLPQLHRNMLEVLGIKNADKLVPLPDDQKPTDPVTENMALLKGEPVKAFLNQDHDAHMTVHMSMMQDPGIMQAVGQNPKAPMIQAALMAHVAEHAGFKYRKQIEEQLGMSLPPEDEKLPPQIEQALSGMMAQAAQQALQMNQQQAQQQQAQQQQQDPLVQMQQQELQMKGQELQLKQQELQLKQQLAMQEMQFKQAQMQSQMQMNDKKLTSEMAARADEIELKKSQIEGDLQLRGMQASAKIKADGDRQQFEQERTGVQIGVDIAKNKAQERMTARQAALAASKPVPTKEKPAT
jgi:hypothetical protein